MRSPRLAALTFKRLFSDSLLVRAAVVAITLVPLLYGALYLWAFWDPYGKLDKMPIALVNLDVPARVDSETITAGADLQRTLLETGTVEWHVVSAEEASAGLAQHRYYLALTIPHDFSKNLATANSSHPVRARLQVVARESSNMLASQIASRVFGEIRAAAGESAAKGYLDNIYVGFADARDGFVDAAAGARDLADGLRDARDGARRLADGAGDARSGADVLAGGLTRLARGAGVADAGGVSLAAGSSQLASGLAEASAGAVSVAGGARSLAAGAFDAHTGATQVAGGTASLSEGLAAANTGAEKIAGGAVALDEGAGSLADALTLLARGGGSLASSAGDLAAGTAKLRAGVDGAVASVGDAASGARSVKAGASAVDDALRAYLASHPEAAEDSDFATALGASAQVKAGSAQLADGLGDAAAAATALKDGATRVDAGAQAMRDGAASLSAGLDRADSGATALAGGAAGLAQGAGALRAGVGDAAEGASKLAVGSARLKDGTGALSVGAGKLALGSAALASGVKSAAAGSAKVSAGATSLSAGLRALWSGANDARDGSRTLASGLTQIDGGAGDLADGLAPAVRGSRTLADGLGDGADAVPAFSAGERAANAEMMSDPVALDTERVGEVPTYGTGFTPYFTPLALWIGALLVFFIISPLPARALAADAPAPIIMLAGYLPAAAIGVVQAVVLLAVVQFGLGLAPVSLPAYYGFGVLTALVFVALLQLFNAALGTVGKLVSIVTLMLQLTSAGGTFPIQMVPGFFQAIGPYLPMTYVVGGLREAISGGDLHLLATDAGVLAAFGLGALLLTTAAAARARTYTMERLHPSLEL